MTDTTTSPERKQTRRDRVIEALYASSAGGMVAMAEAAIAAHPDPEKPKKDPPPPAPGDFCALYAMRGEFQELYEALMAITGPGYAYPRAHALAQAMLEQGMVLHK